jgi:hypothetical protein
LSHRPLMVGNGNEQNDDAEQDQQCRSGKSASLDLPMLDWSGGTRMAEEAGRAAWIDLTRG